jgi:hypothetical protein
MILFLLFRIERNLIMLWKDRIIIRMSSRRMLFREMMLLDSMLIIMI